MYLFIIPLILGFGADLASAFTSTYSRWWGLRGGQAATFFLRCIAGIPLWFAGLALAVGAPSTPLAAPTPLLDAPGWILIAAGCIPMILGLAALRYPAALPTAGDALVERGIYARIRHPIYAGMLLEFLGLALLFPKPTVLLACAIGLAWVIGQARLEEHDLLRRIPGYREYMRRVPPFLPRI